METVTIKACKELSDLKLDALVGAKGKISEVHYHKDGSAVKGVWVELLGGPYLNEKEWYIPIKAIL